MIATVFYKKDKIQEIKGDNVNDLIEDNFDVFKPYITKEAGNAAGYTLEKAWLSRIDNDICEFHVIAHGSDILINYDPLQDELKEVIFQITGIPTEEFEGTYEYEISEKKEFNPFDPEWEKDKSPVIGILEGCVDYLCEKKNNEYIKYPTRLVQFQYPTLKKNNLQLYIIQVMSRFAVWRIRKTDKNKDIFKLIEKLNDALITIIDNDSPDASSLFYHKTLYYLRRRNCITALRYYREKSGKTQNEIAEAIGISLRQYQRYESINSTLPNAKKAIIDRIAEEVGVKPSDLIKYGSIVLHD